MLYNNLKKTATWLAITLFILNVFALPLFSVSAAETNGGYILLEPSALTGVKADNKTSINLETYLRGAYQTFFVVVFVAAVVMLVIGGFEYILTDIITNKQNAKKRMTNAFFGLGIALISYILLYLINPDLTKMSLLKDLDSVRQSLPGQTK